MTAVIIDLASLLAAELRASIERDVDRHALEATSSIGTFSAWGPPQQSDPLKSLNLIVLSGLLQRTAPEPRIVECRFLGAGRVHQERERFSGGVNLSAAARNAARRAEAETREGRAFFEKTTGHIYCSPKAAALLMERFPEMGVGPAPLDIQWTTPQPFERESAPEHFTYHLRGRHV